MLGLDNPVHLAFLLVLLLLVFGAKRLPEIGSSLGAGLRGFKESISGETNHVNLQRENIATLPAAAPTLAETVAETAPVRTDA
ncbi:MAG TPA: twin-arginine translocase TatA/TatE family subunit [Solirubrobacteraceae bacterium]|nr:twin-arginine translocase TatA/TatE family subunit [Solirubrobacteraceae bacterium]